MIAIVVYRYDRDTNMVVQTKHHGRGPCFWTDVFFSIECLMRQHYLFWTIVVDG